MIIFIFFFNFIFCNKMLKFSEQQEIEKTILVPSVYRVDRKGPTQGGNTYNITSNSQPITFEIPAGCVNLSKISFQCTTVLSGAAFNVVNATYLPHFDRVEVTGGNGINLLQLANASKYTKLALPLMTQYDERSNTDGTLFPSTRISKDDSTILQSDCYMTSNLNGTSPAVVQAQSTNGMAYYDTLCTINETPSSGASYNRNHSIKLCDVFPDTILGIDKDIYISASIYIKLYISPLNKFGMSNTNVALFGAYSLFTSGQLRNIGMQVLYQAAPEAIAICQKESELGFSLIVPYTVAMNVNYSGISQSGSFNVIGPSINPKNRIYKVYYGVFIPDTVVAGTPSAVYDCNSSCNVIYDAFGVAQPKLWNFCTLSFGKYGQLAIINASQNEEISLIKNQWGNTSLSSEADFKIYGGIPFVFDSDKAIRKWDGETSVGLEMPNGNFNISSLFTIPPTLTANTLEHVVFTTILAPLFFKNGTMSWTAI